MTNQSPLAEVDPASLDELFDRDPLELTREDITRLVQFYREQRLRWAAEANSLDSKKAKKADKLANAEATKGISISDLDIEI